MVTHSVYFQRQNDSKTSTLIKACWSLSARNSHGKGRELTPRIYLQLQRVDHGSRKISAVCSMLLRQNRSIFCWFTGSAALRQCSTHCQQENFGGKNFHGNKFSQAGVWSRKSWKFLPRENFLLYSNGTISEREIQKTSTQWDWRAKLDEQTVQPPVIILSYACIFDTFHCCGLLGLAWTSPTLVCSFAIFHIYII